MIDWCCHTLPDSIEETNPESVPNPEFVPDVKLQVNRFVGYGLFKLIERVKSQVNRDAREDDDDELLQELEFARSIRIFHVEALTIPTYLST